MILILIQCDRVRPACGSCQRFGYTENCSYDANATVEELEKKNTKLKERIKELESLKNSCIIEPIESECVSSSASTSGSSSISRNTTALNINGDPLITTELLPQSGINISSTYPYSEVQEMSDRLDSMNDPIIDLTLKFQILRVKDDKAVTHYGPISLLSLKFHDPVFSKISRDLDGANNKGIDNSYLNLPQLTPPEQYGNIFTLDSTTFTGTSQSNGNYKNKTVREIEAFLPKSNICTILLDNFWRYANAVCGFIDEKVFMGDLFEITEIKEDHLIQFKIKGADSYVTIATFLLILKFSFDTLSVIITGHDIGIASEPHHEHLKPLIENSVVINTIYLEYSKKMIDKAQINSKLCSFAILQYLLYLLIYCSVAPDLTSTDDIDGGLIAMIGAVANTIGCNRDPDIYQILDAKTKYYWRTLWYAILFLDACHSLHRGIPLMIDDDFYDTKLPLVSASDVDKEELPFFKVGSEFTKSMYGVTLVLREGSELLMNLKKNHKRSEIENYVRKLTDYAFTKVPSISDLLSYVDPNDIITRSERIKLIYLQLELLIQVSSLNYLLYLNCRTDEHELSYEYLRKGVSVVLVIFHGSFEAITKSERFFGYEIASMIIPAIFQAVHKSLPFIISIISRILNESLRLSVPNLEFIETRTEFYDYLNYSKQTTEAAKYTVAEYISQLSLVGKRLSRRFAIADYTTKLLLFVKDMIENNNQVDSTKLESLLFNNSQIENQLGSWVKFSQKRHPTLNTMNSQIWNHSQYHPNKSHIGSSEVQTSDQINIPSRTYAQLQYEASNDSDYLPIVSNTKFQPSNDNPSLSDHRGNGMFSQETSIEHFSQNLFYSEPPPLVISHSHDPLQIPQTVVYAGQVFSSPAIIPLTAAPMNIINTPENHQNLQLQEMPLPTDSNFWSGMFQSTQAQTQYTRQYETIGIEAVGNILGNSAEAEAESYDSSSMQLNGRSHDVHKQEK